MRRRGGLSGNATRPYCGHTAAQICAPAAFALPAPITFAPENREICLKRSHRIAMVVDDEDRLASMVGCKKAIASGRVRQWAKDRDAWRLGCGDRRGMTTPTFVYFDLADESDGL